MVRGRSLNLTCLCVCAWVGDGLTSKGVDHLLSLPRNTLSDLSVLDLSYNKLDSKSCKLMNPITSHSEFSTTNVIVSVRNAPLTSRHVVPFPVGVPLTQSLGFFCGGTKFATTYRISLTFSMAE